MATGQAPHVGELTNTGGRSAVTAPQCCADDVDLQLNGAAMAELPARAESASVRSAPTIQSRIEGSGLITGLNHAELDYLKTMLRVAKKRKKPKK